MKENSIHLTFTEQYSQVSTHYFNNFSPIFDPFIAGIGAGLVDCAINYPPYGLKIRAQRDMLMYKNFKAFSNSFKYLYVGVKAYGMSIIPTTAIQVGIDGILNDKMKNNQLALNYRYLSEAGISITSGMIGAIFATPMDNVILRQQQLQEKNQAYNFFDALKTFKQEKSRLWTAFPAKAIRDSGYTFAMLWGGNALADKMRGHINNVNLGYFDLADIYSSILIGFMCAFITHPFDTVGTVQQNAAHRISMKDAAKHLVSARANKNDIKLSNSKAIFINKIGGISPQSLSKLQPFYKGFAFRYFAIIGGILFMGSTQKFLNTTFKENRKFHATAPNPSL